MWTARSRKEIWASKTTATYRRSSHICYAPATVRTIFVSIPSFVFRFRATQFRVPDVCVRLRNAPSEQIIRTAPLICIEVLSPEDRVERMQQKIRDYLDMGVREVWVADPVSRSIVVYSGAVSAEHRSGELAVPDTPVKIAIADVFQVLDEY